MLDKIFKWQKFMMKIFTVCMKTRKKLLENVTKKENLIDDKITIKDFDILNDEIFVIANSFSQPDEVFKIVNGNLEKISCKPLLQYKVKTHETIYHRIDTESLRLTHEILLVKINQHFSTFMVDQQANISFLMSFRLMQQLVLMSLLVIQEDQPVEDTIS